MLSLAYLARQPILDREGKIYAYELLFRDSPESDTAVIANDNLATAQVLENVRTNIGLPRLIGENKAFVNCNREMLLDNIFKLLNPKWFVLEILEDVEVDASLVNAVAHYKERGFELALDDFIRAQADKCPDRVHVLDFAAHAEKFKEMQAERGKFARSLYSDDAKPTSLCLTLLSLFLQDCILDTMK